MAFPFYLLSFPSFCQGLGEKFSTIFSKFPLMYQLSWLLTTYCWSFGENVVPQFPWLISPQCCYSTHFSVKESKQEIARKRWSFITKFGRGKEKYREFIFRVSDIKPNSSNLFSYDVVQIHSSICFMILNMKKLFISTC